MPEIKSKKMKAKRRKIYSVIKQPIILTEKKCENPMQLLNAIFKIDKRIWVEFIGKAINQKKRISVPYEQDIRNIIDSIKQKDLQKQIIVSLIRIEGYNPFKDDIPVEKMPSSLKSTVVAIQEKLRDKLEKAKSLDGETKYVKYGKKIYKCSIAVKSTENFNKELYFLRYDIILLCKEGAYILTSNPDYPHRPDFTAIYNHLEKREPGVWFLHENKGMMMTKKEAKSDLSIEDIVDSLNVITPC